LLIHSIWLRAFIHLPTLDFGVYNDAFGLAMVLPLSFPQPVPMARELHPLSAAQPPFFVGIDVGGTNIKCGVVDDCGRILGFETVKSKIKKGPEEGARRMADAARKAVEQAGLTMDQIAHIGLATPGTMDIAKGVMLDPPNLPGWVNFPIRDRVSHHSGRPVAYANDANAAAYGEFWVGSASKYSSMVMLTLGTGVGGGIIIDEHMIDGENSHGGECGHMIIDSSEDARLCACGHRGHLEAYTSATGVVLRTEEALATGRKSVLNDIPTDEEPLTALNVHQAAEQSDDLAMEIVMDTARYLAIGITSILHAIDPAAIVLGGAMNFGGRDNTVGSRFLDTIDEQVRIRALPVIAQRITIDFASLGGDAGYIGAAGVGRLASIKANS
ncbi:MAG: ROK family protein, partial [Planctomycetales bacterium]